MHGENFIPRPGIAHGNISFLTQVFACAYIIRIFLYTLLYVYNASWFVTGLNRISIFDAAGIYRVYRVSMYCNGGRIFVQGPRVF